MNLLLLRSSGPSVRPGDFSVRMDTQYADRLISHLSNRTGYCTACADQCRSCRTGSAEDFSGRIAGIVDFPAVVPAIIDDPQEYLPESVPDHDVLIALAVNEEILRAFIERFDNARGIIVPREGSDWISPHAMEAITTLCRSRGVDVSFPKPFCSFDPAEGILREFKRIFRIGLPEIVYRTEDGVIREARVVTSAPCGATFFTARGLEGRRLDEDLDFVADKQLSCFPCTADTSVDRDFRDSIMHCAVKLQRCVLQPLAMKRGVQGS